jgi:hypothetical protein
MNGKMSVMHNIVFLIKLPSILALLIFSQYFSLLNLEPTVKGGGQTILELNIISLVKNNSGKLVHEWGGGDFAKWDRGGGGRSLGRGNRERE